MQNHTTSNLKLGIFVLAGLLFVILLLYMIGKNRNFFGAHFSLKARFSNVDGLKPGHNVRYAGIEVGTVTSIDIMNDTTVEISMALKDEVKGIIRKNALVSIGTDGLVGNKVVNISASEIAASPAPDGSLLPSLQRLNTDEMMRTLSQTNRDIAVAAAQLKTTITRINSSQALWKLLNDESLPVNLRGSVRNIRTATMRADSLVAGLEAAIKDTKNGKGLLGTLLYDTAINRQLTATLNKFESVGSSADSLMKHVSKAAAEITGNISGGNGAIHAILKDTSFTAKLARSLDNISKGTDGFNQNMEALKHNFLFRGYFRRLEKEQQSAQAKKNK